MVSAMPSGESNQVDVDRELLPFLSSSARYDLKFLAIQYFVGLSGTIAGRKLITSKQIYIDRIIELANDNVSNIVKESVSCLINVAGDDVGVKRILQSPLASQFLDNILSSIVQKGCLLADALAMFLSNFTREEEAAKRIVTILTQHDPPTTFDQIIQVMCLVGYNENADLDFLSPFLANLSQDITARKYFLQKDKCVIQRLLPFTQHKSDVRRQAVSAILKNCCFETDLHDWLLSPAVDILPHLLLPLAGPEEFDDDDNEKLPPELQYLEQDKKREPIATVRVNHVEALIQLCATPLGRKYLRNHNTYIIIREYHKWEKEVEIHQKIMDLVDILIGDEPSEDLGTNLKEIEVPLHLQKQFDEQREAELKAFQEPQNN